MWASLVFVAPEDARIVDQGLQKVLTVSDLSRLSGSRVLSPVLSEMARDRLACYLEQFGAIQFKASIEGSAWVGHMEAFSEGVNSRQGRRQLAKVLGYLERELPNSLGDLSRCTIVLTQNGELRAAGEQNARRVYTLPDVDISFSTEELTDHYDIVHQGFRRALNRPSEMDLDPGITQNAARALERDGSYFRSG